MPVTHPPTIVQCSTQMKDPNKKNLTELYNNGTERNNRLKFISILFFCFFCDVRAVNSPLKGSVRTAAGTAAGSGPRTATTFCSVLLLRSFFSALSPPPPPPPQEENNKFSGKFFFCCFLFLCPTGSRHLVHYALVKNRGFLGGRRGAHPSTRPRYARHVGSGEKPRHFEAGGKKKSLRSRVRRKIHRRRQGFGEPCPPSFPFFLHGCDITQLPPSSTCNESSLL